MADEGNENDDLVIHDDLPAPQEEHDDLDGIRIKQITQMKRSAYRSRGYLLVSEVFCIGVALQLMWYGVKSFKSGAMLIGAGYWLGAAVFMGVGWLAGKRAQKFKREADARLLEEPRTPPDFSQLSDGSQAWKNLEDVE